MKIQRLIFLIFTTIVVFACVTDHPSPQVLKISENTLRFSGNGGVWKLTVNSNCEWKITGGDTWCTTDKMEGSKTAEILIQVDTNDTKPKEIPVLLLPATRKRLKYMYIRIQAAITIIMNCPLFFIYSMRMKPTVCKMLPENSSPK